MKLRYIKSKDDNQYVMFDDKVVPNFPGSFPRCVKGVCKFTLEQEEWVRMWFKELVNIELSQILNICDKTIIKVRRGLGEEYVAPISRTALIISMANKKRLEDPKQRAIANKNLELGRYVKRSVDKAQRKQRCTPEQLEAKRQHAEEMRKKKEEKARLIAERKLTRENLQRIKEEKKNKKKNKDLCDVRPKQDTPTPPPRHKKTKVKSYCIANCWCKITKQCSTNIGSECEFDLNNFNT